MSTLNLHGFLANYLVTISLDVSSPVLKVSSSVAHILDLSAIFAETGQLSYVTSLIIPTLDGHYSSCLDLVISYGLPADIVLGADWVLPCQPIFSEGHTAL